MSRPTTAPTTTPAAVSHGPAVVVSASSSRHDHDEIQNRPSEVDARGP